MMLMLRLAHRNVFRSRARTLVSILSIAVGATALIVNAGVVMNIFRELREDAIHGRHGHLQIYRAGYSGHHLGDPDPYYLDPAQTARILALVRAEPGVARATPRRAFSGLISNNERRASFLGIAVDPRDDPAFSAHTELRAGRQLSPERPYGVLAGLGLARKLDARPGDHLMLLATTASSVLNAVHVTLQGVFEGGLKEYDDWTLKVPLAVAAQLLQDDRSEQIVVLLHRTEDLARVRTGLEEGFRVRDLALETRSWSELAQFHNQVVGLFGRELDVIRLIVAAIVVLGIGNTIGMSIFERGVELATLRALGLRRRAITCLLALEALLTGLIGAALGTAGGIVIALVVSEIGILYPSPPGSTRPFLGGIDIAPGVLLEAFLVSMVASLLAAALPTWRAMRQPIATALRHA